MTKSKIIIASSFAAIAATLAAGPASAQRIAFSTPAAPSPTLSPGRYEVPQGGLMQIFSGNSTATVSLNSGAVFSIDAGGQITVESGSFTATTTPISQQLAVRTSGGSLFQLSGRNSSGSFQVAADGAVTGRGMGGNVAATGPTGPAIRVDSSSFAIAPGGSAEERLFVPAMPAVANANYQGLVQQAQQYGQYLVNANLNGLPVGQGGVPQQGNPLIPVAAQQQTPGQLLSDLQALSNSPDGFDFADFSAAYLQTYINFLNAGGVGGQLNNITASQEIIDYVQFLAAGGNPSNYPISAGLLQSYFDIFRQLGLPPEFEEGIGEQIRAYQVLANAGITNFSTAQIAGTLQNYVTFLQGGGIPAGFNGFGQAGLQAYLNYIEAFGLPDNIDPQLLIQIENYQRLGINGVGSTQAANALSDFVNALRAGGSFATYGAQNEATLRSYLALIQLLGVPAGLDAGVASNLNNYLSYLSGGGSFGSFPAPPPPPPPPPAPPPPPPPPGGFTKVDSAPTYQAGVSLSTGASVTNGGPVAFDANGVPTRIDITDFIRFTSGTATAVEQSGNRFINIGRYVNGTTVIKDQNRVGEQQFVLGTNQGAHYMIALLTPSNPANGLYDYNLSSATSPTYISGATAPGAFDGRLRISVNGGNAMMALTGTITMSDSIYSFGSADKLTTVATTGQFVSLGQGLPNSPVVETMTSTGNQCANASCQLTFRMAMTGELGQYVGANYSANLPNSDGLLGAAIFEKVAPNNGGAAATRAKPGQFLSSLKSGQYNGGAGTTPFSSFDVTFDAVGAPITVLPGVFDRGRLEQAESISGTEWIVGRFGAGTPSNTVTPQDALPGTHFGMMRSLTGAVPTSGTANFDLAGWTSPTINATNFVSDPSFSGKMAIRFGTVIKWGINASLSLTRGAKTTESYAIGSASSLATPLFATDVINGRLTIRTPINITGTNCSTAISCFFKPQFQLGGTAGNLVGGTWQISNSDANVEIRGAAVFAQSSFTPGAAGGDDRGADPNSNGGLRIPIVEGGEGNGDYGVGDLQFASYGNIVGTPSNGATMVFDTTGAKSASPVGLNYTINRGTNSVADGGSVLNVIGWSRWTGGATNGTGNRADLIATYGANQGGGFIYGVTATDLPTLGSADYRLIGKTAVVTDNASPLGTVESGSLRVAFGAAPRQALDAGARVGVVLGVRVNNNDYVIQSQGGIDNPSMVLGARYFDFNANTAGVTGTCGGTCPTSARLSGFLAGPGASHAGISFAVGDANGLPGFNGVAAFAKGK